MRGLRLKNILVSFLCTIAVITGSLPLLTASEANLSFAMSEDEEEEKTADEGTSTDEEPVIRIATWYNEYNLMYLKAYLAMKFPDITIKYEYIDKSNYEPIIDSMLSYKGAPDILYVDREMVSKHALTRYISDVTDLCDGFTDKARISFMYGNCVYAVPSTSQFECIYYNRDLFKKKNVKVPETFSAFLTSCDQFSKAYNIRPVTISLKNPYTVANLTLAIASCNYFHTDRGKGFGGRLQYGRTTFSEELAPYIADFDVLMDHEIITKDMYTIDSRTAVEEFVNREAAMIVGGPETYNAILQIDPAMDIGTVPFFGSEGTAIIGGCDVGFALNSNAQNMDIAREILISLASREGQLALWNDRPGSQTYLKDDHFDNLEVFDGIQGVLENDLAFTPWMDWGQSLNKAAYYQLGREMQRVMLGKQSTTKALSNVDRVVYDILREE